MTVGSHSSTPSHHAHGTGGHGGPSKHSHDHDLSSPQHHTLPHELHIKRARHVANLIFDHIAITLEDMGKKLRPNHGRDHARDGYTLLTSSKQTKNVYEGIKYKFQKYSDIEGLIQSHPKFILQHALDIFVLFTSYLYTFIHAIKSPTLANGYYTLSAEYLGSLKTLLQQFYVFVTEAQVVAHNPNSSFSIGYKRMIQMSEVFQLYSQFESHALRFKKEITGNRFALTTVSSFHSDAGSGGKKPSTPEAMIHHDHGVGQQHKHHGSTASAASGPATTHEQHRPTQLHKQYHHAFKKPWIIMAKKSLDECETQVQFATKHLLASTSQALTQLQHQIDAYHHKFASHETEDDDGEDDGGENDTAALERTMSEQVGGHPQVGFAMLFLRANGGKALFQLFKLHHYVILKPDRIFKSVSKQNKNEFDRHQIKLFDSFLSQIKKLDKEVYLQDSYSLQKYALELVIHDLTTSNGDDYVLNMLDSLMKQVDVLWDIFTEGGQHHVSPSISAHPPRPPTLHDGMSNERLQQMMAKSKSVRFRETQVEENIPFVHDHPELWSYFSAVLHILSNVVMTAHLINLGIISHQSTHSSIFRNMALPTIQALTNILPIMEIATTSYDHSTSRYILHSIHSVHKTHDDHNIVSSFPIHNYAQIILKLALKLTLDQKKVIESQPVDVKESINMVNQAQLYLSQTISWTRLGYLATSIEAFAAMQVATMIQAVLKDPNSRAIHKDHELVDRLYTFALGKYEEKNVFENEEDDLDDWEDIEIVIETVMSGEEDSPIVPTASLLKAKQAEQASMEPTNLQLDEFSERDSIIDLATDTSSLQLTSSDVQDFLDEPHLDNDQNFKQEKKGIAELTLEDSDDVVKEEEKSIAEEEMVNYEVPSTVAEVTPTVSVVDGTTLEEIQANKAAIKELKEEVSVLQATVQSLQEQMKSMLTKEEVDQMIRLEIERTLSKIKSRSSSRRQSTDKHRASNGVESTDDSEEEFNLPLSFDEQDNHSIKLQRSDSHEIRVPAKTVYVSPENRRTSLELAPSNIIELNSIDNSTIISPNTKNLQRIESQMIAKQTLLANDEKPSVTSPSSAPPSNIRLERKIGNSSVYLKKVASFSSPTTPTNPSVIEPPSPTKEMPTFQDRKAYFESRTPPAPLTKQASKRVQQT